MGFFSSKHKQENLLTKVNLLEQLEEIQKNRDFLLTTVKTLLFCFKEVAFDIEELGAEDFKLRLEKLYESLTLTGSLRSKERLFEDAKEDILDFIKRENAYFKAKESELKKIIEVLLDGMKQTIGDNRDFNTQVYEANLRVEQISQLDDIRRIKDSLSREVSLLKRVISEKQAKDEKRLEGLNKEVQTLRVNLEVVQKASVTDGLTGANNRMSLDTQFRRMIERGRIAGSKFSLLLCDIDNFKAINDTYGHQIGDRVLKAFVKECQSYFRQEDFIGRYGGEEFVILLPNASLRDAVKRAEVLCKIIAGKHYAMSAEHQEKRLAFTVSIGVSTFHANDNGESMYGRADKALYRAKKAGKNRAVKE